MMYAIAFHLTGPRESYDPLVKTLQGFGDWSTRIPNFWLVQTPRSARQMRDALKPLMGAEDRLFIAHFDRNWSATNMGEGFGDWMGRRTYDPPGSQSVTPVITTPLSMSVPAATATTKGKPRPGVRPPKR